MIATDEIITQEELIELLYDDEEEHFIPLPSRIATCAGAWIQREDGRWQFYKDEDDGA
jgi:hypothetical protein